LLESNQFQIAAGNLLKQVHRVMIVAHPAFGHGQQFLGHIDLARPPLGQTHRKVIGGTVLFPSRALTARLSTLGEALDQRGAQDRAQSVKLLDELFAPLLESLSRLPQRRTQ
jgi:hypothetical protein